MPSGPAAPEYGNQPGMPRSGGHTGLSSTEMHVVSLLVQQAEFSDVILLNKTDLTSSEELERTENLLRVLNPRAIIRKTEFGVVDVDGIVHTKRASVWLSDRKTGDGKPARRSCGAPMCADSEGGETVADGDADLPAALQRLQVKEGTRVNKYNLLEFCAGGDMVNVAGGASNTGKWGCYRVNESGSTGGDAGSKLGFYSFAFESADQFCPSLLAKLLKSNQDAVGDNDNGALHGVIRSKGVVWLAGFDGTPQETTSLEWSQAGGAVQLTWGAQWAGGSPASAAGSSAGKQRQELVFIGDSRMNEGRIAAALSRCIFSNRAASKESESCDMSEIPEITMKRFSEAWVHDILTAQEDGELIRESANELHRFGRFSDAIRLYDRAIQVEPNNVINFQARMALYMRAGALRKAVADAKSCIRLRPTFVPGYLRLSSIHMRLGEYDEVRANLAAAAEASGIVNSAALEMAHEKLLKVESTVGEAILRLQAGQPVESIKWIEAALVDCDKSEVLHRLRNEALSAVAALSVNAVS